MGESEDRIYQLNISEFIEEVRDNGVLRKAWYNNPELGNCLFKETHKPSWLAVDIRSDWSEKVIYEIATLLNLPVARYEFATGYVNESTESVDGIVSVNCIPINSTEISGEKFLMANINYESSNHSEYIVERVLNTLQLGKVMPPKSWTHIPNIDSGAKLFVGYLILDALVNNKDRHDHNWGVIAIGNRLELIPSFDHGFSLGASENISKPEFSISYYLDRYRSSFHDGDGALPTLEVFVRAAKLYPEAAQIWQDKLRSITPEQIDEIFNRIPEGRITPTAATFAKALLEYNRSQILNLDLESIQPQLDEQAILTAIETLKQEVIEASKLPTLDFDKDTLSYMRDFVIYRSTKDSNNLQPTLEYEDELNRRLFKAIEDDISIFSGYISEIKYLIEEEMSDEGLINPLSLDDSGDEEDSDDSDKYKSNPITKPENSSPPNQSQSDDLGESI
jgi:hypothetical protein